MISTHPTSSDIIQISQEKRRYKVLFCIKQLFKWAESDSLISQNIQKKRFRLEKLKNIPAEELQILDGHPAIQLWCANIIRCIRHNEIIEDGLFEEGIYLLKTILDIDDIEMSFKNGEKNDDHLLLIKDKPNYQACINANVVIERNKDGISFLANQPLLLNLLGNEFKYPIESEIKKVKACFEKGKSFLSKYYPRGNELLTIIDALATLNNSNGEITSCSTEDFDGLIVIAENNPPVLIAEQLIHESAHIHFQTILNSNKEYPALFSKLPAFYSPFTDNARPPIRLAHGIVSYTEVLSMWIAIKNIHNINPFEFGLHNNKELTNNIDSRVNELQERISTALRNFQALLNDEEYNLWLDLYQKFVPDTEILNFINQHKPLSKEINIDDFNMFNNIEKAEFLLATKGSKVSRISMHLSEIGVFSRKVNAECYFCFSNELIIPKYADKLNQFSNIIDQTVPYLSDHGNDADTFIYVSKNPKLSRKAFDLDSDNNAGTLFEIPNCCQSYFKDSWNEVEKHWNGDLASFLLTKSTKRETHSLEIPWQLNAFAMYWSGGLTWHFPCSLECKKTISIINRRLNILNQMNKPLCKELLNIQKLPLLWTKSMGMGLFQNIELKSNCFENILWDSESEIPIQLIGTGLDPQNMLTPANYDLFYSILGNNWKIILWK